MNTIANGTAPIEFLYKNEEEAFVEDILATHDEEIDSNGGYRRDDEMTSFGTIPHSQSIDKVSSVVDSVFVSHFEQRPSDRFTDIFEQTVILHSISPQNILSAMQIKGLLYVWHLLLSVCAEYPWTWTIASKLKIMKSINGYNVWSHTNVAIPN